MSRDSGFSLPELLIAVALMATISGAALAFGTATVDEMRTSAAARHVAARVQFARMEALKRSANVGYQFSACERGYSYAAYVDGNGNGLRSAEIRQGVDWMLDHSRHLADQFPGVSFGIVEGVTAAESNETLGADASPIRLGSSSILSFSPVGTSTSGTLYVRGPGRQQRAVRVLGGTGRVRVLRFDFRARRWAAG
jgi:prepilin-type N-terminal cleavage/methylation domain-containing protein